jgi:hypothetical protein
MLGVGLVLRAALLQYSLFCLNTLYKDPVTPASAGSRSLGAGNRAFRREIFIAPGDARSIRPSGAASRDAGSIRSRAIRSNPSPNSHREEPCTVCESSDLIPWKSEY